MENIGRIADYLNEASKGKSVVITTHTGAILKELKVDTAYVILNGEIICKGEPQKVWECINKQGYEKCLNCEIVEK